MASQRTLDAILRLAERPGTEAEGIVAREMLRRLSVEPDRPKPRSLEDILRGAEETPMTREELAFIRHSEEVRIRMEASVRYEAMIRGLKKGDRIYFNQVRYPKNDPGTVCGPTDGSLTVRVRLDRNMWPTRIHAYQGGGKCLSLEPLD